MRKKILAVLAAFTLIFWNNRIREIYIPFYERSVNKYGRIILCKTR